MVVLFGHLCLRTQLSRSPGIFGGRLGKIGMFYPLIICSFFATKFFLIAVVLFALARLFSFLLVSTEQITFSFSLSKGHHMATIGRNPGTYLSIYTSVITFIFFNIFCRMNKNPRLSCRCKCVIKMCTLLVILGKKNPIQTNVNMSYEGFQSFHFFL